MNQLRFDMGFFNQNKNALGSKDEKEQSFVLDNPADLAPLLERVGDVRHVLLGEASHGTHEYYTWRTAISKKLIVEKGFNFIAVEGDWPDCYKINRYVKGFEYQDMKPEDLLKEFDRWPTWMWANWEIVSLITWLKEYNSNLPADKRVGFYGLDVYSLWESMESLMKYLEKRIPKPLKLRVRRYSASSHTVRMNRVMPGPSIV